MRNFDFKEEYQKLLTPDIVALLTQIHEHKGQQNLFIEAKKDALAELLEIARIQSTEASNRIEGIITTDERLKKIVRDKTVPKTRSEREIAGYRDVLGIIHENYDYIPIRPGMILQLYRDLYKYSGSTVGGNFKNAVTRLCDAFNDALGMEEMDPLLLIPMFILDFLCIHPFNSGNGRMSRLMTLLLLYRAGYIVGKYISIENVIADTKDTYYEALQDSSCEWHEGANDYRPFVRYMLEVIVAAYRDFSARVEMLTNKGLSKPDRIREMIRSTTGKITKKEIMEKCPDISKITVQRAMTDMQNNNEIIKIGGGRYTSYAWNWGKE